MTLTDEQRQRLEHLAACGLTSMLSTENRRALRAALAELDALRTDLDLLALERDGLRTYVAQLEARIGRHEARARAWEYDADAGGED